MCEVNLVGKPADQKPIVQYALIKPVRVRDKSAIFLLEVPLAN